MKLLGKEWDIYNFNTSDYRKTMFVQDIVMTQSYRTFDFGTNRQEKGNILFNDALGTFYLQLNDTRYMVEDHLDVKKGNTLRLL